MSTEMSQLFVSFHLLLSWKNKKFGINNTHVKSLLKGNRELRVFCCVENCSLITECLKIRKKTFRDKVGFFIERVSIW